MGCTALFTYKRSIVVDAKRVKWITSALQILACQLQLPLTRLKYITIIRYNFRNACRSGARQIAVLF